MKYATVLAKRMEHVRAGEITRLLKAAAGKDVLSLAGGHPAVETFPVDDIKEITGNIFEKYSAQILQYDVSQGLAELLVTLRDYISDRGINASQDEIGISSGAQNAIDAVSKVLINKGDRIAIESPTFFYSIQTFLMYDPEIVEIKSDSAGVLPEDFERACQQGSIKFFYIIPNFQNPRGTTLSYERRVAILDIAQRYGVMIVEDDPYYELRYEGEHIPPMKSIASEQVIYIGSFSKTFSPGMRLGYYVAPKEICDNMTAVRQVDDIHANRYAQTILLEYIRKGYFERNLMTTNKLYTQRLHVATEALEKYLDRKHFSWSKPQGGLFIWIEGPPEFKASKAYAACVKEGVVFVPGNFFFNNPMSNDRCLRLNFTSLQDATLRIAIKKLSKVLNDKKLWDVPTA